MVDAAYTERRIAELYDHLYEDRSDLDVYAAIAAEFGADRIVDLGCGTGIFACLLARLGYEVTAVDPAEASLEIARSRPDADRVVWVHGYAADLPPVGADVVFMTANVAQEIVSDDDWAAALRGAFAAMREGGRLVFETRDPAVRAWQAWNREQSYQRLEIQEIGMVQRWFEVDEVADGLVTFSGTYVFESDGLRLTPTSSLRFRSKDEVTASLTACGFTLDEIRDAPDRPGQELVFVARRPDS